MHSFFPIINNDELFFSLYGRYHARSLNKTEVKTLVELQVNKIFPTLPNNIQNLVSNLRHFDFPNKDYFLNFHTMYNYISNFISPNDIEELYKYMTEGTGKISSHVGFILFSKNSYLKYCPLCNQRDFETLGESYWRLSHQIPTIFTCLKHDMPLEKIESIDYALGVTMNETKIISKQTLSKKTIFYVNQFAQQSYYLNRKNLNLYNNIRSQDFYRIFTERGFVTNKKVNVQKLEKQIINFFGIEFLELAQFKRELFNEISQRPLFFSNTMTPVEILVLINFFFKSLSGIFIYNNKSLKRRLDRSLLAELLV